MKKRIILLFISLCITNYIIAQVKVSGYMRNGTYVEPHYRSNPDGNPYNNYSYPGNVNPYTGKVATGNPNTYLKNYSNKEGNKTNYNDIYLPNNYSSDNISTLHTLISNEYKTFIVIRDIAYFYDEPNSYSSKNEYVKKGTTLKGLKRDNGFVYVSFIDKNAQNTFGWIKESNINYIVDDDYLQPTFFVALQTQTYLYTTPNDYNKSKAYIIKGEVFSSKEFSNGFIYVDYVDVNGIIIKGWIKDSDAYKVK